MTVLSEESKITYIGSSSQTLYPIPFEFIKNDDIKVSIYDSNDEFVEDWTYSTQYVVQDNNVKVLEGYEIDNTKKMLVKRTVDYIQDNKYREGGDFPAKSTETSFDKTTMMVQQLQEEVNRCPKVNPIYNLSVTLPAPDAGKGLIWNADENGFTNSTLNIDDIEQLTLSYRDESLAARDAAKASETNAKASELAAKQSETNAKASETNAKTSENNAEIWAEGTDSQVQALGGIHSAKGWAEANENLNYTDITNCITKIPQDIKIELNNGTLTLKAGSKVYVPNGDNIFNPLTTNSDINLTLSLQASTSYFLFATADTDGLSVNGVYRQTISNTSSGSSVPTGGVFYDTTNNKITAVTDGVQETTLMSFPLCAFTTDTNGQITSIDQVFNGFGYIGSTIFALPSVEGLIPNGRNTDGSLNNIKFTTTKVLTKNISSENNWTIVIDDENLNAPDSENYIYNDIKNINIYNNNVTGAPNCIVGFINTDSTGRIIEFNIKTVFNAIDRNEAALKDLSNVTAEGKESSINWGVPDYTAAVSVSENTFTAPCACYVVYKTRATNSNGSGGAILINGIECSYFATNSVNSVSFTHSAYASKGDTVTFNRAASQIYKGYFPLKGAN